MKQKNNTTNFVDKNYFKKELDATTKELRQEIKLSAKETVRKLEDLITGVKDIIMNTMDSFAQDIETNREDRDLAVHQTSELRKDVDDHGKRITALEKS